MCLFTKAKSKLSTARKWEGAPLQAQPWGRMRPHSSAPPTFSERPKKLVATQSQALGENGPWCGLSKMQTQREAGPAFASGGTAELLKAAHPRSLANTPRDPQDEPALGLCPEKLGLRGPACGWVSRGQAPCPQHVLTRSLQLQQPHQNLP